MNHGSDVSDTLNGENVVIQDSELTKQILGCLDSLQEVAQLGQGKLLVVGASSSEVVGQKIGTATSLHVGQLIVHAVSSFAQKFGFDVAYQCCEHLNRALVIDRVFAERRGYTEVSAIPVPGAGGAVAATAYQKLRDPCLVAGVIADAGIDIGDTLIGMHLRAVVVPVRGRYTSVGRAHVTMARTRPPLIGGNRTIYDAAIAAERLRCD